MSFTAYKSDNGAVTPHEYLVAAAGTYKAGQLLGVTGGKLAALTADTTTTPPYLCLHEGTVTDGTVIPVARVSKDLIYETTLSGAAATAAVGAKLAVASGGLHAKTGAGTFELVYVEGTAADSVVRGRFA